MITAAVRPAIARGHYAYPEQPGEGLLTAMLFLEMRRKVLAEIEQLRQYAAESHVEEVRRVLTATADRLEDIIGRVPA